MKDIQAVVLGAGGVGKSSLTLRFLYGEFYDSYDPTIEETYRKDVQVDGEMNFISILDTAGAEQFMSINDFYIQGSTGFILVFSLTQASSLREVEQLRKQIFRVKRLPTPQSLDMAAILSGGSGTSSPPARPSLSGDGSDNPLSSAAIAAEFAANSRKPSLTKKQQLYQQQQQGYHHVPNGSVSSKGANGSARSTMNSGSIHYGPGGGQLDEPTTHPNGNGYHHHHHHNNRQSSPRGHRAQSSYSYHQSRPSLSTAGARNRGVGAQEAMAEDDHFSFVPEKFAPIPMIMVGTKSDLPADREVSRDAASRISTMWGCPFFETSSKQNLNVNEAFVNIIRQMRKDTVEERPPGKGSIGSFLKPGRRSARQRSNKKCTIM